MPSIGLTKKSSGITPGKTTKRTGERPSQTGMIASLQLSQGRADRQRCRLTVVDAVRSLAKRLCRKSHCFALRRPVEEGDQLIDDGAPIRLRRDVGGDQALGLDAERGVDAERGFEFGGSVV